MNKLSIFLILSSMLQAQINIGVGLNTSHIKSPTRDYDFVEDNNLVAIEYEKDATIISLSSFKNSFGNQSEMLLYGHKYDKNNKGWYATTSTGIVHGYNRVEILNSKTDINRYWVFDLPNVIYKDYGWVATASIGYKFNPHSAIEVNLFGNCIETTFKYLL